MGTQQRPFLAEKHHQYHQSFPSVVLTSSASKSSSSLFCHPKHSKISKIKIFYLLGEPYLFIVLPTKQKLAFMAFFLLFPPSLKKTADFFSLWRLFIRSKKRKQHFFDLKKYFFLFICFFQSLKICECLNTK